MPAAEMGRTFSLALKEWGLQKHPTGESITLYSIRNSAISSRIRDAKWDLLQVSQAADVSIMQISKAYASEIMKTQKDRYANTFPTDVKHQREEAAEIQALMLETTLKNSR